MLQQLFSDRETTINEIGFCGVNRRYKSRLDLDATVIHTSSPGLKQEAAAFIADGSIWNAQALEVQMSWSIYKELSAVNSTFGYFLKDAGRFALISSLLVQLISGECQQFNQRIRN